MACRFQSPTIVGWMPCFVANCAVVSSPRSASSATFALNSAEYRCRLLVIQVRPSQEQTELKPLSEFAGPPHQALDAFETGSWGGKYPAIAPAWRRQWQQVVPFFAFPPEVRRIIYTTNALESLNSKLRSSVRSRGHFPSDEAATKTVVFGLARCRKELDDATAR